MGSSLRMAKLLVLALFCVALAATAPDFELEDEPRSVDVASPEEDGELYLDDEPRSDLESIEGNDGDENYELPDMRDATEELADNSEDLEPTDRIFSRRSRRRWRRRFRRWGRGIRRRLPRYIQRGRQWYNRYQAAGAIWALYG